MHNTKKLWVGGSGNHYKIVPHANDDVCGGPIEQIYFHEDGGDFRCTVCGEEWINYSMDQLLEDNHFNVYTGKTEFDV